MMKKAADFSAAKFDGLFVYVVGRVISDTFATALPFAS